MKELKKMCLANIKGKLTRKEMKNIMAGSGSGTCITACNTCTKNSDCCSTVCASDQPGCGSGRRCLK